MRSEDWLQEIPQIHGFISPHLGIRFELTPQTLEIYRPDGQKFLTPVEIEQLRLQEHQRAEEERQAKEVALQQLEQERQKYQDLMTRLQERGINPEEI